MIEFRDVSYQYPNQDQAVLKGINLAINNGEWVALLGHNGSGKSTLAKLINGLIRPTEGQVIVDHLEMSDDNLWKIRQNVGMVFQNPENQFIGTTVVDDVVFGLENLKLPRHEMERRVDHVLNLVGLVEHKWHEPFHLSGGQKQRLAIASVLAMLPNKLILDEATTMLDPMSRTELIETIKRLHEQESLTTVSITHDMNEVLMANRVIVLKNGSIWFDGKLEQLIHDEQSLTEAGLQPPFVSRLSKAFKNRGVTFKQEPLNIKELVKHIWTFHSKT